jgi:hypothetical protein
MPNMLRHQYRDDENSLLGVKRLAYFAGPEATDTEDKSPEAKQQAKHAEELEEFFKMEPGEAQQSRTKATEQRDESIKELFDGFKGKNKVGGYLKSFIWEESGRHGNADKKAISSKVGEIAEGRVKTLVDDIDGWSKENYYLNTETDRHTELTLTLLNEKSVVLGEFKGALEQKLKEEQGQLSRVNRAVTALKEARTGVFKRFKGVGVPKMDEINDRIKRYSQMGEAVKTLTAENNEELKEKKKEETEFQDKESIITEMLLERAPELASELDEAIMQATLSNDISKFTPFLVKHRERLNITEVEHEAVLQMLKTFFLDNKIATDYYLNQQRELGKLNRDEDDLKTRAERLKNTPAIKNANIDLGDGEANFRIVGRKNGGKKIFLQDGDDVAILDLSKIKEPRLTLIEDGEAPKSYKLKVPPKTEREGDDKRQVSLTAMEFSAEKIDLSPPEDASSE